MSNAKRGFRFRLPMLVFALVAGTILPALAKPPLPLAIRRQQSRNEYIRFEAIVDSLDITAGMTILDIGAGPGYASFLFAERLRGTGEVYATDIREDFVRRIGEEANRRALKNLFPVLVKSDGLDEFYGKHRYDLVFLSNVYHCLEDRVDYFRRLRGFLNPGARLVLVLYNQAPLFTVGDLSDTESIVDSLAGEDGDDPFRERLSPGTRQLMEEGDYGEELDRALVDDFNRMLVDPLFYRGFYKDSYFRKDLFDPSERDLANWLLMTLREDGVMEKPPDRLDGRSMRTIIRLNRMFFAKRFGDYLAEGGRGAYIPAGDANRQTSSLVMLRELEAAGYTFVRESHLSPFFDAFVMVPRTP